jgi:predicted phosphodiesterase
VLEKKYGSGHREALKKLSHLQTDTLINAPEKLLLNIDGLKILMCHGSPTDANLYLYPDSHIEILNLASNAGADFVLIGHSHYQFMHIGENGILLNPGSVGQSRLTGGLADWAIIETKNRVVQLRSTLYDTSALITEIVHNDPDNDYLSSILKRNRN